jgi:hypothetical protein
MKKMLFLCLAPLTLLILISSCKKEEKAGTPIVLTDSSTLVNIHSAVLNGSVSDEGGSAVSIRGFCYSANPDPGLNDSVENAGFGPGDFNAEINGLISNRIYYYRAFATNGVGTAFGAEMSFLTDTEPVIDPGPSLLLKGGAGYTSGDATIQMGETIKVGVIGAKSSVSGNNLRKFSCIYTVNDVPTIILDSTFNADSFNWEKELEFNYIGNGFLTFELTDQGNLKATEVIHITVNGSEIEKYINVELGSWNDAIGSFFSTSEGIVYNITQTYTTPANQVKIDFLFFKGTSMLNTIASPDDPTANTINDLKLSEWANKNQTRFNSTNITVGQFDAIGDNYNFPDFNINEQTTNMNLLSEGDVILFKTQSGKPGLIKIVSLYTRGDKIKMDVIIEK